MNIFFAFILLFTTACFGQIPDEFIGSINNDSYELRKMNLIGYKSQQMDMLFNQYIAHLAHTHKKIKDRDFNTIEVIHEIKKIIRGARTLNRTTDISLEHYTFEGVEIPFVVSHEEESDGLVTTYAIKGIRPSTLGENINFSSACLSLDTRDQSKIMNLSWIGTKNALCPLPHKEKLGNYLLRLAESFAKTKGMIAIGLQDCSTIVSDNDVSVSLKTLHLYKQGQTWYNSHGYFSERGKEYDLLVGMRARNFSLKRIEQIFIDIEASKESLEKELQRGKRPDLRQLIRNYYRNIAANLIYLRDWIDIYRTEHINPEDVDSLGDFFGWLWEVSPENYQKLESFVFPFLADLLLPSPYREELNLKLGETTFYKILNYEASDI